MQMLKLEIALWRWCTLCIEKNIELLGPDIRRKALEFNEILSIDPHFKASYQWLRKLRERYNISQLNVMKYFMSPTKDGLCSFKNYLKRLMLQNKVALQNVYNVSYTEILWKAVPEKTSIFDRAKWTGDQDMCEDHVTILLCTNATGCHKLPVLIIGSIAEPQGSSILNDGISTTYKVKANAWLDNIIFNQWFEEYFLKSVKERQEKNGRRQETVLLLDNNRVAHNLKDLNKKDKFVKVVCIPFDVSLHMLPLNNEVISCFKRMYRRELVLTLMLLPVWNTEEEVIETHKKLTLWDNMLLKDVKEVTAYMRTLPGCERITENCVLNWFNVEDVRDIVMKICTDEVLQSFGNTDIVNDEAGPSHSKIPKVD
ncbi:jerky protein homolog-like [Bombus pyrosoma]|uniref:jerky protein homolog-like n=1 Tax=Bombus pyrosoma TaxID=396416 RepID=UPI001CB94831|nr:jerky protein homolog-like [Bombus pyrosoma]